MKKRLLFLLTMLIVFTGFISACGNNNIVDTPQPPDPKIAVLEDEISDLEAVNDACISTVSSQDAVITELIDDVGYCTEEYQVLGDAYDELLASTPEPTPDPTPEPTEEPASDLWRYVCGTVTIQRNVFQKQYKASGEVKRNPSGNLIMKPVPGTKVAPYHVGDKVCVRFDPFQVDGGRVTLISGTRGSGYFFPMNSFDFVKPYNPNE